MNRPGLFPTWRELLRQLPLAIAVVALGWFAIALIALVCR